MKIYVASKSKDERYALDPDNVIAACGTGPDPETDALSYAKDETRATDAPTYIYAVDVQLRGGYEIHREVVYRGAGSIQG